jgi:SAM-dependent methyltransferase
VSNDASSLAHYEHVSLYDAAFKSRKEDVRFFVELAKETGGPVLEFGAGSGRVTLALAKAGVSVTAVDASKPMLDALDARLQKIGAKVRSLVETKKGDMRRVRAGNTYPLVLATFNVVGHLKSFHDMARFLRNAKAHLSAGGLLAFDVPLPHPDEVEADPDELFRVPRFRHPDLGHIIEQTERFEYDPESQQLLVESTYSTPESPDSVSVPLILRQWFPKEVEAILMYEGFSQIETRADYSPQPGLLARDTLVFLARV